MSNEAALEVSNPVTQGDVNQAVSLVVQDKLQKAGITDQTLSELKSELEDLSKIEVVDEASFKLIHGGAMKATNARTTITKICKAGREYAISEQKAWIAAERDTISSFSAQENALKAKKDGWIAKKEREEREELERKEQAIRARLVAIEQFGFSKRTGSIDKGADYYTNGITTVEMSAITMSDDEVWGNLLNSLRMVWEEGQAAKAEKERVEQEERDRLQAQREEHDRKERELKERMDAFNGKINEARANEMVLAGMYRKPNGDAVYLTEEGRGYTYPVSQLHGFENWPEELDLVRSLVADRDEAIRKDQAAADREALIAERVKALKEAGWELGPQPESLILNHLDGQQRYIYFGEGTMLAEQPESEVTAWIEAGRTELARRKKVEQDRIAAEAVEAERKRQEEEAKRVAAQEEERKAKLSDVERWDAWMVAIEENAPNLVSAQGAHAVSRLLAYIKDKYAPSVRNELKK
jgi:hypothetical protein